MLGMALRDRGDFGGAELAFDACVMLEPGYLVGYGARALVLAKRAGNQAAGPLRDETMARALSDSEHTLAKAPYHPVTYWARGDLMRALDKRSDAIEAYTRALELEDNVHAKFSGQVAMLEIAAYLQNDLAPEDVPARVLLAFIAVASKNDAEAIDRATQALRLRPDDARAHAILGAAYLETGNLPAARTSFDAALKIAPSNTLAALGLARVMEATAGPEDALAAYTSLSKIAVVREHKLQAQLGIYRLTTKLGRGTDAAAARAAAHAINPARSI
jgi:cytochrome c-type biogenesis protein CcmH/NrfG